MQPRQADRLKIFHARNAYVYIYIFPLINDEIRITMR